MSFSRWLFLISVLIPIMLFFSKYSLHHYEHLGIPELKCFESGQSFIRWTNKLPLL